MVEKISEEVKGKLIAAWDERVKNSPDDYLNFGDVDWMEHGGRFVKFDGEYFEIISVDLYLLDNKHFFIIREDMISVDGMIVRDGFNHEDDPHYRFHDNISGLVSFSGAKEKENQLDALNSSDIEVIDDALEPIIWVVSSKSGYDGGGDYPIYLDFKCTDKYTEEWEKEYEEKALKVETFLKTRGLDRNWESYEQD